ncbi:MAG: hypothetical protein HS108_00130 [Planctomycetes bacterium]|nr:hypothetical protein [Planctomycetota bacterium]MCL4730623.1 hypothetical protein [Planctomycetota bacterium]
MPLLQQLVGQDLRPLAERYCVTVWKNDKLNKGWAGHVIERHLGLQLNSSQAPNLGSWELKVVPLKRLRNGRIALKETMAITMIDPVHVAQTPFEKSHLLTKLERLVLGARMFESRQETSACLVSIGEFRLADPAIRKQVRQDYETIRATIIKQGFDALTGRMGIYIQPRTKGRGHGSTSRAFYARKNFVAIALGLNNEVTSDEE